MTDSLLICAIEKKTNLPVPGAYMFFEIDGTSRLIFDRNNTKILRIIHDYMKIGETRVTSSR